MRRVDREHIERRVTCTGCPTKYCLDCNSAGCPNCGLDSFYTSHTTNTDYPKSDIMHLNDVDDLDHPLITTPRATVPRLGDSLVAPAIGGQTQWGIGMPLQGGYTIATDSSTSIVGSRGDGEETVSEELMGIVNTAMTNMYRDTPTRAEEPTFAEQLRIRDRELRDLANRERDRAMRDTWRTETLSAESPRVRGLNPDMLIQDELEPNTNRWASAQDNITDQMRSRITPESPIESLNRARREIRDETNERRYATGRRDNRYGGATIPPYTA